MDRRELLRRTCGMGLCACAGSALMADACPGAQGPESPDQQLRRLQWWQDHTKRQMARLWVLLEPHLDEKTRQDIIEQLGRNCASTLGWAKEFKGNVQGFFRRMQESQGEQIVFDQEKGLCSSQSRFCCSVQGWSWFQTD